MGQKIEKLAVAGYLQQKEIQKKSAQYSGLSFLSALSTPTLLTILNQFEAPLWLSFTAAFVFMLSTFIFYFKYNRMAQLESLTDPSAKLTK